METKQFGNTNMHITRIGFGAWAIGGGNWAFAWGPQNDNESIAAIHRAIEVGMNWIDTAAVYGLGHSEAIVGKAIKGMSNKPYIFTKCGLVWDENRVVGRNLKATGERSGYSAGEVAIAWTLRNPAVTAAIVGGRSAEQVDGICRAEEIIDFPIDF